MLNASAQNLGNSDNGIFTTVGSIEDGSESGLAADNPGGVPDDPDATQVPFDDYVPFLIAGVLVYGVCVNQKRKTVAV